MSTPARFPLALRVLHWALAALVLAMLFIGLAMVGTAGPAYATLIALHRPIGIAILALALVRLVIRLRSPVPALPDDLPTLQARAARGSHVLLYAAMIGLPLIGWAMLSAGGYPVRLTPGILLPPILPESGWAFGLLRLGHTIVALLFLALILGHLTVALAHGLIRRDGVLRSMTFGREPAPTVPPKDEGCDQRVVDEVGPEAAD